MGARKSGKPSLDERDADGVVGAIAWLMSTHFGGNRTALAQELEISGSGLSQITGGKHRPSYLTAKAVAGVLSKRLGRHIPVGDVLTGRWRETPTSEVRPITLDDPEARSKQLAKEFAIDNGVPREFVEQFDLTHLRPGRSSEQIYQVIKGAWIASDGLATGIAPEK